MKIKSGGNYFSRIKVMMNNSTTFDKIMQVMLVVFLGVVLIFAVLVIDMSIKKIRIDERYASISNKKHDIQCDGIIDFITPNNYQLMRINDEKIIRVFHNAIKYVDYIPSQCNIIIYDTPIDKSKIDPIKSAIEQENIELNKKIKSLTLTNEQLNNKIYILSEGYKLPSIEDLNQYIENYKSYKLPEFNKWLQDIKSNELKKIESVKGNLISLNDDCGFNMVQDNMEFFDLWVNGFCEELKKKIRDKDAQR